MEKIDVYLLRTFEDAPDQERSMFILTYDVSVEKRRELESYLKVTDIMDVIPSFIVSGNLSQLMLALNHLPWIINVKLNSMARITTQRKPSNIVYKPT